MNGIKSARYDVIGAACAVFECVAFSGESSNVPEVYKFPLQRLDALGKDKTGAEKSLLGPIHAVVSSSASQTCQLNITSALLPSDQLLQGSFSCPRFS